MCETQEELANHVDTYPVHKKIVGIQKTSGITINPDSFCGHSDMPYFISSDDIVAFNKEKSQEHYSQKRKQTKNKNMAALYAEAAKEEIYDNFVKDQKRCQQKSTCLQKKKTKKPSLSQQIHEQNQKLWNINVDQDDIMPFEETNVPIPEQEAADPVELYAVEPEPEHQEVEIQLAPPQQQTEAESDQISPFNTIHMHIQLQGEKESVDLGGPRKDFFVVALREMKDQYFNYIRELSKNYTVLGKIIGYVSLCPFDKSKGLDIGETYLNESNMSEAKCVVTNLTSDTSSLVYEQPATQR
ncbi:Hypothetical predicted protein [Mytilus galloprovincialis]|uniref:Uncharacterized protein n=1 Tax=Mytilus galloprovincialis TaxID=29158 RepID=A0A8B6DKH0_MYTGA|nr:Hypothetical predicted protein [Mytilus galloprovincialis]